MSTYVSAVITPFAAMSALRTGKVVSPCPLFVAVEAPAINFVVAVYFLGTTAVHSMTRLRKPKKIAMKMRFRRKNVATMLAASVGLGGSAWAAV